MKKEEFYPQSKAHLPKEGMNTDSSRFGLRQPLDKTNDFSPEGFEANEYFLYG